MEKGNKGVLVIVSVAVIAGVAGFAIGKWHSKANSIGGEKKSSADGEEEGFSNYKTGDVVSGDCKGSDGLWYPAGSPHCKGRQKLAPKPRNK